MRQIDRGVRVLVTRVDDDRRAVINVCNDLDCLREMVFIEDDLERARMAIEALH